MPNVRPPYPNELYHYGVKGMHWGVRRYQPYPKGYSGSGKYLGKRSRVGMFGKKAKVRKLSDEEKEQLVKLGTVNELLKYSDQLSTEERNRAVARVESQRRLKALRYSGALKTYNDVTTAVGNTSKILKTGLEIKKLGGEANKKAPKDYSYDSISTYYDRAPRNGTGADWSGIYGGSKVDKLMNKEREEKREKLRKRRRNMAIGLGVGGAAALGAGLYLSRRYGKKARLLKASSQINEAQSDALLNNSKKYMNSAKAIKDSANELIRRGNETGNRAMLNTAKAQLMGNTNSLRNAEANAIQSANLMDRASNEARAARNYSTKSFYAKLLAGAGGTALADAGLYGLYARRRKLRRTKRRR